MATINEFFKPRIGLPNLHAASALNSGWRHAALAVSPVSSAIEGRRGRGDPIRGLALLFTGEELVPLGAREISSDSSPSLLQYFFHRQRPEPDGPVVADGGEPSPVGAISRPLAGPGLSRTTTRRQGAL
jgi:hypothetical protein